MKLENIVGTLGIIALQGSALPVLYTFATVDNFQFENPEMIVLIWFGLLCLSFKSLFISDIIMKTSNYIGFTLQSIVMGFIFL